MQREMEKEIKKEIKKDKESTLEFDEFLMMKEQRRLQREKGSKSKQKGKRRNVKTIDYNPLMDYEEYEEE